jgi:hypothetical protein
MSAENQNCQVSKDSGCLEKTPKTRPWLSSRHVIAEIDTHITTEELLEEVFPVRSVQSIYNESRPGSQIV